MLAMWGGFETRRGVGGDINRSEVVDTTNAVFLPRYAEGALLSGWSTMIPLAPIWPGFAVNSAIFGAAWGVVTLIVLGPGVIVRTRRNARSACFACGYPVGSSTVCTECGQVLKTRMSASA